MTNNVKYLFLDVDGTLTDGKLYIGPDGEVMKVFSVLDGYGIKDILPRYNIIPVILTGRTSKIVERRCFELNITDIYQGVKDKVSFVCNFANEKKVSLSELAYMGDDMIDFDIMQKISEEGGITGCPNNAIEIMKKNVSYLSQKNGGEGAVRDFIEWICDNQ